MKERFGALHGSAIENASRLTMGAEQVKPAPLQHRIGARCNRRTAKSRKGWMKLRLYTRTLRRNIALHLSTFRQSPKLATIFPMNRPSLSATDISSDAQPELEIFQSTMRLQQICLLRQYHVESLQGSWLVCHIVPC